MEHQTTYDIHRIFLHGITVRDIAEPLLSFDTSYPGEAARAAMEARRVPVACLRREGRVCGFILVDELGGETCEKYRHELSEATILENSTPLIEVIRTLQNSPWALVKVFGEVGGIVNRLDLQDPPVRMWLFGLITIIEMHFKAMREARYPDDGWTQLISPARLARAQELLSERRRRNQNPHLLDCLQFSDKGKIIARDETLRKQAGFVSRRRGDEVVKSFETLRNNLAHSQDIVAFDWDTIVGLANNLERVIELLNNGVN